MKISYSWIQELTDTKLSLEEIADRLTMAGLEVEAITSTIPEMNGVVVGEVAEVHSVQGSDYLKDCKVNIGSKILRIVCGAPNIEPGQKVPVATPGTTLPNGMQILEKELKGIRSQGMICSESELGISGDESGIMVLDYNLPIGEPLQSFLGNREKVIELSITPNRPDCLGVIGIAREICISEKKSYIPTLQAIALPNCGTETVPVEILDLQGCPRYTARLIRNVKIGPSPQWLVARLQSAGLRSICNVVDVTNYVMLETGQPLHAFDYDNLHGGKIIVRSAKNGETFITLDGSEHQLAEGNLLICDGERPVALAGIMGGLNSEVSNDTVNVLLESAYFAPISIRKTAKQLGLATDSARRFERGVDPNGAHLASNRAAQLILEMAGGQLASELIDVYPQKIFPASIKYRPARCNKIIGLNIAEAEIKSILIRLGCTVEEKKDYWEVKAPTFRPDLVREIDLIEEVARIYGYNEIPNKTNDHIQLDLQPNQFDRFIDKMRRIAVATSLSEIVTISMVSQKYALQFVSNEKDLITLMNPLSEDMAVLRPSLLCSMLPSVAYNLNRKQVDIRFFEIGNIFKSLYSEKGEDISEKKAFAGILTGNKFNPSWEIKPKKLNFFDLKGLLIELLHQSLFDHVQMIHGEKNFFDYGAELLVNDKNVGYIGKISPNILNEFDIDKEIFAFELFLDDLFQQLQVERSFSPIPQFPAVERDIAIVIDSVTRASEVEQVLKKSAGPLLKAHFLFDVYQGRQIPEGKKSLAFSLVFRSEQRTLRDDEVNQIIDKILENLKQAFGAELRQ